MEPAAVEVKDLTLAYRARGTSKRLAVDSLSFRIERREIVGFIGPNGAGKTSTIKCLLDLIPASSGACLIAGMPSSDPRSRQSVGYMPEVSYYPGYLKLSEFLHTCAAVSGMTSREGRLAAARVAERVGMTQHMNTRLSGFSKGMLQQAGFAQALIHDPEILVLDEPMSGLDPIARMRMRSLLSDLRAEGKTILFSSHELGEIEMVADRILLLNEGRLVYQGAISQIVCKESSLEQAYVRLLGEELPCAA